jgi:hypothetical protein
MEKNKAQQLWYFLNRFDREDAEAVAFILGDQEEYPFFYLLNWNFNQGASNARKTALCSPIRRHFHDVHYNAPEVNKGLFVENNQSDIIEEFLKNLPSLPRPKKGQSVEEYISSEDLSEIDWTPPVSETFAIILVKQQKYQQAIDIYEQLILAKPEKRLYFATRISELKQIINE